MLKIFLYLFFLKKIIYSLPQTEGDMFTVDADPQYKIVNLIDTCPCDLNEGICDKSDKICCCDKDCLPDMLNPTFYEKNKECDPSSYISRRINSKLDYCDDYTKSLDDLYNPLILAFKILKKGFCLYADHFKKTDDKTDQYDKNKNTILTQTGEEEKFDEVIRIKTDNNDFSMKNIDSFKMMNFNAPIALPSGLCLFNSYPIKKYEDYEVICSYKHTQNNDDDTNYLNDKFPNPNFKYLINDAKKNFYRDATEDAGGATLFKKIEIIYYDNVDMPIIKHYYENVDTPTSNTFYQDLTFVVKFLKDENDYKKSGNPGYIKGKPLLILEKNEDKFYKYNNDKVFPIDYDENIDITDIYYNDYFDNKITFEDLIIYGYQNNYCKNYIKDMFSTHEYYVGQLGNANAHLINDWKKIEGFSNQYNPYLLMGLYQTIGTVNNAQIKIKEYAPYFISKDLVDGTYTYFISKFFKLKKIKTKWWYALPPGFFKLPRNTMYPFKVGTTNYQDGN